MPGGWHVTRRFTPCDMNSTTGLVTALAALFVAGCATRVPQVLNASMIPKQFTGPATPTAPLWPDASWWQEFRDPQLTNLVATAQTNNLDLTAAAMRVLQAAAQS